MNRLKLMREKHGLSQNVALDLYGLTQSYLSLYETGSRDSQYDMELLSALLSSATSKTVQSALKYARSIKGLLPPRQHRIAVIAFLTMGDDDWAIAEEVFEWGVR